MSEPARSYGNGSIIVDWRPELCVHCSECVDGLPQVFNLDSRPWVNIHGATSEEIVAQVEKCPSKALSIRKAVAAILLFLVTGIPVTAQDAEPQDLRPDIVMYTPDFACVACDFWKLNMMPKLIQQGHRVLILQRLKLDSYPAFHVLKADGKWSALRQGSMRLDQYRAIVDGKPVP